MASLDGPWQELNGGLPIHGQLTITEPTAKIVHIKAIDLAGNTNTSDTLVLPARLVEEATPIANRETKREPTQSHHDNPNISQQETLPSIKDPVENPKLLTNIPSKVANQAAYPAKNY